MDSTRVKNIVVLSNGTEWCRWCWMGALSKRNFHFWKTGFPLKNKFILWLCTKHFSPFHRFPLKKIWYRFFLKNLGLRNDIQNIIIFYDWNILATDAFFISELKKSGNKLVYMFTNIVSRSGAYKYMSINYLRSTFDAIFAFDRMDAQKYGFNYHPLIYEKNFFCDSCNLKYDLFYVGQAKDRLDVLLEIYVKARQSGLVCDFHIIGVPLEKQKYSDGIVYNKPISYKDVICHILDSKCLVDVIQGQSTGLTIKVCESVIFNKKLITTNRHVKEENFYKKGNIMVLDKEISIFDFIKLNQIQYEQADYYLFSVDSLLDVL